MRIVCHQPPIVFKEIFEQTIIFQEKEFFKEICEIYIGDLNTGFLLEDTRNKDGSVYECKVYNKEFKEVFTTKISSDMTLFLFKTIYQS